MVKNRGNGAGERLDVREDQNTQHIGNFFAFLSLR